MAELNSYDLSRAWFDWCFENPEMISPNHTAIYFFAIEHCNRLGWKDKFGFPTQMAMDAIGIKKHQTYIKYFQELIDWGFIKLVQKSQNQYSANIISLMYAKPKNGKPLDKAFVRHAAKQTETNGQSIGQSNGQSTGQSNSSIDKQRTKNKEQRTNIFIPPRIEEVIMFFKEKGFEENIARRAFDHYALADPAWTDSNGKNVRSWKSKMNTVWCKEENRTAKKINTDRFEHNVSAVEKSKLEIRLIDENEASRTN